VRPGGADQHRHECEGDGPRAESGDEQHASDQLGRKGRVAENSGKPERLEKLGGARQREHEVLEERVGDEHRAQRKPQQKRGGGGTLVLHRKLLGLFGAPGATTRMMSFAVRGIKMIMCHRLLHIMGQ